jgi:hypothetical protein
MKLVRREAQVSLEFCMPKKWNQREGTLAGDQRGGTEVSSHCLL